MRIGIAADHSNVVNDPLRVGDELWVGTDSGESRFDPAR